MTSQISTPIIVVLRRRVRADLAIPTIDCNPIAVRCVADTASGVGEQAAHVPAPFLARSSLQTSRPYLEGWYCSFFFVGDRHDKEPLGMCGVRLGARGGG